MQSVSQRPSGQSDDDTGPAYGDAAQYIHLRRVELFRKPVPQQLVQSDEKIAAAPDLIFTARHSPAAAAAQANPRRVEHVMRGIIQKREALAVRRGTMIWNAAIEALTTDRASAQRLGKKSFGGNTKSTAMSLWRFFST